MNRDFTAYRHPVMAVPCPSCMAKAGTPCKRPSEHRAAEFHSDRKRRADREFIRQHGAQASISQAADGSWVIDPEGYVPPEARTGTQQQGLF